MMMPGRQTRNLADFSTHNIDINHDWVNESWLQYPKMEEAESFIQWVIGDNNITKLKIIRQILTVEF